MLSTIFNLLFKFSGLGVRCPFYVNLCIMHWCLGGCVFVFVYVHRGVGGVSLYLPSHLFGWGSCATHIQFYALFSIKCS